MILLPCAAQATHFYPRSPCGERHNLNLDWILETLISIHALLAESDPPPFCWGGIMSNFYPRSPCGERLYMYMIKHINYIFLSTLSLRRATATRRSLPRV